MRTKRAGMKKPRFAPRLGNQSVGATQAFAVAAAAFFERFTRERTVSDGLAPLETQ